MKNPSEVALQVAGETLTFAFENAALGMMNTMIPLTKISSEKSEQVYVLSHDRDELLVDFLNELLFIFHIFHFVWNKVEVELLSDHELRATIRGEKFNPQKHEGLRQIKGVASHPLEIARQPGGEWKIRVIVNV